MAKRRVRNKGRGKHKPITRLPDELTSDEAKQLQSLTRWTKQQGLRMPRTRGECADGERPCPWVRCRYHAYIEIMWDGSIKLNWPDREIWEIPETCILDVSGHGELTLEDAGDVLNLTRERVRQIQRRAMIKLQTWNRPRELRRMLVD